MVSEEADWAFVYYANNPYVYIVRAQPGLSPLQFRTLPIALLFWETALDLTMIFLTKLRTEVNCNYIELRIAKEKRRNPAQSGSCC